MNVKKLKDLSNKNFGIILSNTIRSLIYLNNFIKYKTIPKLIIIYSRKNISLAIQKKIKKISCKIIIIKSDNINSNKIENDVINSKINNFIFSSYPGEIIKNKSLLNKINLLHSHSGLIPKYMGSTPMYYSIILEKKSFCTTFVINKNIDQGSVLLIKNYNLPKKNMIDNYDNEIRVKNLIYLINSKKKIIVKKKINNEHNFFYKAHPILRNIANRKLI